ncbi:MAG: thermostable hemolysin [Mariprofundales bacterium]|nr:thermostable hemolysin [Mariprofundales bacterium]
MIDLIPESHEARRETENFIHQRFAESYHANVSHFMPYLLRIREDGSGTWQAVAGLRPATTAHNTSPLFVEHYLDQPVEECITTKIKSSVERREIVEIGNLAEATTGGSRLAIIALTGFLTGYGFNWVVFTAIPLLVNAFPRLGMSPVPLAQATLDRLSADAQQEWGSYYDQHPTVMCGDITNAFHTLDHLETPLSDKMRASLLVGYHMGVWWRKRGF